MSTFRFLLSVYRLYWGRILISALTQWSAAVCIFGVLPFVTKKLLNQAVAQQHISLILILSFVGVEILIPIFFRLSDWVSIHYQPLLRHDVANRLLDYMQQHSLRFFQREFSGNLSSKMQDALTNVVSILETILFDFSFSFFGVIPALFAIYSAHIWFAILLSIWVVIFFAIPIGTPNSFIDNVGSGVITVLPEKSVLLPIKFALILPCFPFNLSEIDFNAFPFCSYLTLLQEFLS